MTTETPPGTLSTTPPPDLPPIPERPTETPAPEAKPASRRPTTRAGRRAQAAARAAQGKAKESTPKASTKAAPRRASLESRLSGSIASVGTGLVVAGAASGSDALQADGMLVVQHGPGIASALDKLAKDNPAVAAALERMLTAGAWSGVIAATVPLAIGIAANHGALPKALADQLGAGLPAPEPAPAGV